MSLDEMLHWSVLFRIVMEVFVLFASITVAISSMRRYPLIGIALTLFFAALTVTTAANYFLETTTAQVITAFTLTPALMFLFFVMIHSARNSHNGNGHK